MNKKEYTVLHDLLMATIAIVVTKRVAPSDVKAMKAAAKLVARGALHVMKHSEIAQKVSNGKVYKRDSKKEGFSPT